MDFRKWMADQIVIWTARMNTAPLDDMRRYRCGVVDGLTEAYVKFTENEEKAVKTGEDRIIAMIHEELDKLQLSAADYAGHHHDFNSKMAKRCALQQLLKRIRNV